MAYENPVLVKSYNAGEDLSTHQYKAVEFASGSVQRTNAITDVAVGVLQNDPSINQTAVVMHAGITKAIANAAIAQGAKCSVTAAGKLQTAVSTQHVLGIALEAAAADGDIFTLMLTPGGPPLP